MVRKVVKMMKAADEARKNGEEFAPEVEVMDGLDDGEVIFSMVVRGRLYLVNTLAGRCGQGDWARNTFGLSFPGSSMSP